MVGRRAGPISHRSWLTALSAIYIARRFNEASPLYGSTWHKGWSAPLYLLLAVDIGLGQLQSLQIGNHGAMVSLNYALLTAMLFTVWLTPGLAYISPILGVTALMQWMAAQAAPRLACPWV